MTRFSRLFAVSALFFTAQAVAEKPTLTVYTYDSFTTEWGAAPKLLPLFEQQCDCWLKFMPFEDGVTMFNRLRLEGRKSKADVVLGMDNFLMPEAEKSGLFAPHQLATDKLALPTQWENPLFFPYDYSEYAFIYDNTKLTNPPKSLKELVERQDLKVIYQDPRTSTVGRGLLLWINAVYGEQAVQAWQQLAKHTVTIGKGWSETYGVFLKGEADLVLSYTTSPLYHQWYEQDNRYTAAAFSEGHLAQIEVAAITQTAKQPALARQFLQFLQQPEAQQIIARHNIMKPVIGNHLDPSLQAMPSYPLLTLAPLSSDTVKQWLATWQTAVSQ